MADSVKVILPVWHNVTAQEIRKYSMPLSVRIGGRTESGIDSLASELSSLFCDTPGIRVPEISDELSQAKQTILYEALQNENRIMVKSADLSSGAAVCLGKWCYNDSEKQRKLFLYALNELIAARLVDQNSDCLSELSYTGIQAAERLEPILNCQMLGIESKT